MGQPSPMFQSSLLHSLDLLSTISFAASGTLLARERHCHFLSALAYAELTAVGGGTLRDVLLGRPIFWTQAPIYALLALGTGMAVFFCSKVIRLRRRQLMWLDNIGLATFSVIGTQIGLLRFAAIFPIGPVLGLMTAMGGGCLRDVVSGRRPTAFNHPQAVVASLAGGGIYGILSSSLVSACWAAVAAISAVLLLLSMSHIAWTFKSWSKYGRRRVLR